jgi:hypothetical protein
VLLSAYSRFRGKVDLAEGLHSVAFPVGWDSAGQIVSLVSSGPEIALDAS